MKEDDCQGVRPIFRPKNWQAVERRKEKEKKKNTWSTKGGYIAPIFVPSTPNGELARSLRRIADSEAEAGVRFKIVETGGRTVKSLLQRSNPTETVGCDDLDCLPCQTGRGEGGNCHATGVNYAMECQLCPAGARGLYLGETARNLYSRCKEHDENYKKNREKSFIKKHQEKMHQGATA